MTRVFLDASYAIALASVTDAHHRRALEIAQHLDTTGTRLVTTRAVVLEIGNALARSRYRSAAVALLDSLEKDPRVEVVPVSEELFRKALVRFKTRPDQEWGLTDCLSFVVMDERRLIGALTANEHFRQAGYQPLLLESARVFWRGGARPLSGVR